MGERAIYMFSFELDHSSENQKHFTGRRRVEIHRRAEAPSLSPRLLFALKEQASLPTPSFTQQIFAEFLQARPSYKEVPNPLAF